MKTATTEWREDFRVGICGNNDLCNLDSIARYILTNTYFQYIVCDATKYNNEVLS